MEHLAGATHPDNREGRLGGSILVLLAGLAALGALSTNIILPSFPSISRDLQTSQEELGLTLSSFFIAFALGQLIVGPLSDRLGRRWLIFSGLAVFVLGSVVCAISSDISTLITGRIIQAIGVSAASVLSRAVARDVFEGERLTRSLAFIMVAMAAAPGFSPLLGGALEQYFGWRVPFYLVGSFGILVMGFYMINVGETHPIHRRTRPSFLLIGSGYLRLAVTPRFFRPAITVSLIIGALFAFFASAPAILMGGFHLSALELGWFFAATVIVVFSAGMIAPKLARKYGPQRVAVIALLVCLLGGIMILYVSATETITFGVFSLGLVIFLFGMGFINPLCTALTLQPFGEQAGLASALLGFLQMGCAAIGTTLATSLDLPPSIAMGAVLTGAAFLGLALFTSPLRNQDTQQETKGYQPPPLKGNKS